MDDETIEFLSRGKEDHYKDTDLHEALDDLPHQYKTIIILRFFEDLKLEEIADITGKTSTPSKHAFTGAEAHAHSADEGGSFLMERD